MRLYLLHAAYAKSGEDAHRTPWLIHLVCKTPEGRARIVVVRDWLPWVYAKTHDEERARELLRPYGIDRVDRVARTQLVGFTNERRQVFHLVRVRKYPVYPRAPAAQAVVYEGSVKAPTKFFAETGLRSGGWFDADRLSDEDVVECRLSDLRPLPAESAPPALTFMAYDLETTGLDPSTCTINQVCCVFWDGRGPPRKDARSVVVCSQPTDPVEGTTVRAVDGEVALLEALRQIVLLHQPDVLTGYNITFDNKFIRDRCRILGRPGLFAELARPETARAAFVEKTLSTSAMGANEMVLWDIPGRVVIDLFIYCKANFPTLSDFKLDTAGEVFLNERKHDVPFGLILRAFDERTGDPAQRARIAAYCEQDGFLCLRLMHKWCAHVAVLEVRPANICTMRIDRMPGRRASPSLLRRVRAEAARIGIRGTIRDSTRAEKKLMLIRPDGRIVHFGLRGSLTYVEGASRAKRAAYRARHSAIRVRDGRRAVDVPYSPAHLSYRLLW